MRAKKLLTSRQIFRYAVPARTVTKKHCLGLLESEERGSDGLFCALKEATEKCGFKWKSIFSKTSLTVTDGASENTGQHHSLWRLLSEERNSSELKVIPLMKIWCGVHGSQHDCQRTGSITCHSGLQSSYQLLQFISRANEGDQKGCRGRWCQLRAISVG